MITNRRERAWKRSRLVELAFSLAFAGIFLLGWHLRPVGTWFWIVALLVLLVSFWIWQRQLRALDELGKLRFMKSWMVCGIVTNSTLALLVAWVLLSEPRFIQVGPRQFPVLPFWGLYGAMLVGLLSLGLTNWVLNRGDSRRGFKEDSR